MKTINSIVRLSYYVNILLSEGVRHIGHSRRIEILSQMPSAAIIEDEWHELKGTKKQAGFKALDFKKMNIRKRVSRFGVPK